MSTEKIYQAVLKAASGFHSNGPIKTHLDIGSGSGELIRLLNEKLGVKSSACDYTEELMKVPGQTVDVVNLNHGGLPYPDGSFDFVTATEIIEHLEDYRRILGEIHRVLRKGGACVLSTPNTLSINSRLRYLWFGFPDLFGPLQIGDRSLHSTAGHVSPVPFFYLAHALMERGFSSVSLAFDRYQRSGIAKLLFFFLPVKILGGLGYRREVSRYGTIDRENSALVKRMNSLGMLAGRTIIVSAVK